MRKSLLAVPAIAGVVLFSAAGAAGAANGPQQYVTHFNYTPDTTDLPNGTGATLSSDGGGVWAFDNLMVTYKVIPLAQVNPSDGANYVVDETVIGSFHGFADPVTGAALTSHGPVHGTFTWDVSSPVPPKKSGLPSQEPAPTVNLNPPAGQNQVTGGAGDPDAISQLFQGQGQIVNLDSLSFSYQNGNFTQAVAPDGSYTLTGDVRGH